MASKRSKTTARIEGTNGGTHRSRGRWTIVSPGQQANVKVRSNGKGKRKFRREQMGLQQRTGGAR